MFNIKTAAFTAVFALLTGTALAGPSSAATPIPQNAVHACPTGQYNANDPGEPVQCVKCAAPGCPSCHNERTKETVAASTAAADNCPSPGKPH